MKILTPLLILSVFWLGASWSRPATPPANEIFERTGKVSKYRLDADGTVYICIRASAQGEGPSEIWFRSPANRTNVSSVEEMLLSIATGAEAQTLTFAAEADRVLDGLTPENAYPMAYVERLVRR